MKHKDSIEEVISLVNEYLGIDCTKHTRRRDYCDARSIVVKIMKDDPVHASCAWQSSVNQGKK